MPAPYAKTVLTGKAGGGGLAARSPLLLAGLGAGCISASAVLVTLARAGAATTAFYRCFLALPLLFALAAAERRRLGARSLGQRLGAAAAGVFLAVDLVLWTHAIVAVGAGAATVLGNLQVIFVTVAAWLLFRERPGGMFLLALPFVMGGVALVSGLGDGAAVGGQAGAGIVYGVSTSLAYGIFLLVLRQASAGSAHVAGPLADATLGAAAGSLLLGVAFGGLQLEIPWGSFGWLLVLALTSQTAGWLLITSSLPRLPAALSSLMLLLQPAAAMLLAAAILGQRPSLLQIAGAALVCGGVIAASRKPTASDGAHGRAEARRRPADDRPACRTLHPAAGGPPGGSVTEPGCPTPHR